MPVFTNPISSQNSAASAGVYPYPSIGQIKQYGSVSDEFTRSTIIPTNAYPLYSVTSGGTDNSAIQNFIYLELQTDTAIGNSVDYWTSGLSFAPSANFIDLRSMITADIIFVSHATDNFASFIGLLEGAGFTSIPSTGRQLGVIMDPANNPNFQLASANGTTQVKTDTGEAINTNTIYRLNIIWSGVETATLNLYKGTNYSTLVFSKSVTSISNGNGNQSMPLHFWVQTATTASKSIAIIEWKVSAT